MFSFGAFLLSSNVVIAVADGVPNINVKKTCRDAATASGTAPTQKDIDNCVADEQGARDELVKVWAQFSDPARARCVRASTDYSPSYVEVLTCLSMARDAKGLPEGTTPRPRKQRRLSQTLDRLYPRPNNNRVLSSPPRNSVPARVRFIEAD
jgi:hypothetical protein